MTIDAKKLAAALRFGGFGAANWREALCAVADKLEEEPAQTEHWIGPFVWHGGECPVPPETMVEARYEGGGAHSGTAAGMKWRRKVTSFSYLADNPEGWIELPREYRVPMSAYPIRVRYEDGREEDCSREPHGSPPYITHIRLLPPGPAVGPELATNGDFSMGMAGWQSASIPDDVRQVVREALEAVDDFMFNETPEQSAIWSKVRKALDALDAEPKPAPIPADVRQVVREALKLGVWSTVNDVSAKISAAIDALDASPPEKVVGYASIKSRIELRPTIWSHAKDCRSANPSSRIVKLVEVPDQ